MTRLIHEEDSLKLVEKLIRRIVHDLSNPLAAVVGFAELLTYPGVPEEKRSRYVQLILEQATRARHIIDTMSQFGDIPPPLVDELSVQTSVRTALSLRQVNQKAAGIEATVEVVGPDPVAVADRHHLGRILMNLLVNAEQAFKEQSTEQKRILVRIREVSDRAEILVADSAGGVPAALGETVFEPFVSGRRSGGLGLGLHVSRHVARRMGGDLVLLPSEPATPWPGARFVLTLPMAGQNKTQGGDK